MLSGHRTILVLLLLHLLLRYLLLTVPLSRDALNLLPLLLRSGLRLRLRLLMLLLLWRPLHLALLASAGRNIQSAVDGLRDGLDLRAKFLLDLIEVEPVLVGNEVDR